MGHFCASNGIFSLLLDVFLAIWICCLKGDCSYQGIRATNNSLRNGGRRVVKLHSVQLGHYLFEQGEEKDREKYALEVVKIPLSLFIPSNPSPSRQAAHTTPEKISQFS